MDYNNFEMVLLSLSTDEDAFDTVTSLLAGTTGCAGETIDTDNGDLLRERVSLREHAVDENPCFSCVLFIEADDAVAFWVSTDDTATWLLAAAIAAAAAILAPDIPATNP